jgi:membrane protein YqaA with SNARE-associated domain
LLSRITSALVAYGPWGVFLLGLIDSIGVPLPATMDALIILIAVKAPERAFFAASMGVLGSLGGNLALFEMARFGVSRFVREVANDGKPSRFREWFHRYGLVTVFIPAAVPVLPLPLKFFVISAGVLRTPRAKFLSVILVARVLRYFGDAFLGVQLGADAQGFLHRNAWTLVAIAIGVAAVMVGLIRWNDRRRAPNA